MAPHWSLFALTMVFPSLVTSVGLHHFSGQPLSQTQSLFQSQGLGQSQSQKASLSNPHLYPELGTHLQHPGPASLRKPQQVPPGLANYLNSNQLSDAAKKQLAPSGTLPATVVDTPYGPAIKDMSSLPSSLSPVSGRPVSPLASSYPSGIGSPAVSDLMSLRPSAGSGFESPVKGGLLTDPSFGTGVGPGVGTIGELVPASGLGSNAGLGAFPTGEGSFIPVLGSQPDFNGYLTADPYKKQKEAIERKMQELGEQQQLKDKINQLKKMQKLVDSMPMNGETTTAASGKTKRPKTGPTTTMDPLTAALKAMGLMGITTESSMAAMADKLADMEKRMDQMEQSMATTEADEDAETTTEDEDGGETTTPDGESDETTTGADEEDAEMTSTEDEDEITTGSGDVTTGSPSGAAGTSPLQHIVSGVMKLVQTVLSDLGSLTKNPPPH